VQVKAQVAPDFVPVDWPATRPEGWLAERLGTGEVVGFDPWLHTTAEIERTDGKAGPTGASRCAPSTT
jgi:Xaa-Pro aminopeptidase